MLCAFCTNLCKTALREAEKLDQAGVPLDKQYCRKDHIPAQTAAQLRFGVKSGCYMCGRFWAYSSEDYRRGVNSGRLYPPQNKYDRVNSFMINVLLDLEDAPDPQEHRRIYIYLYHSEVAYHGPFQSHLHAEDTQSFTVLLPSDVDPLLPRGYDDYQLEKDNSAPLIGIQIKSWMDTCTEHHSECPKPKSVRGEFPTRLFEVGDTVRVREAVEIDKYEPYVTLSYTWGDSGVIKTTDDTISKFKAGVPLHTLPETLRDAINITRSIGVKYIWIDSLCIIQDQKSQPTDFSREAPHMGEIYSNSLLTIAASRGRGTHTTCFSNRESSHLKPPRFEAPSDIKSRRYGSGYFYVIDQNIWRFAVSDAPLNSRGWVLQERLLSPRTVHFCKEQTFWECSGLAACESLPAGLPHKVMDTLGSMVRIPQNAFKSFLNLQGGPSDPASPWGPGDSQTNFLAYGRWSRIVEAYSRCGLTNPTDRVVAIAGVASRLKMVFNDTFVAGLWKGRILHGLAWQIASTVSRKSEGKRPLSRDGREVYCGPSWSWVSVVGEIIHDIGAEYKWEHWKPCATVISCVVEPRNEEFNAPVKNGTALRLQGRLQTLKVETRQEIHYGQKISPTIFLVGNESIRRGEIYLDVTKMEDHLNDQIAIAPVLVNSGEESGRTDQIISLLLRREGNEFERIGLVHVVKSRDPQVFAELLRRDVRKESFQIV